MASPVAPKTTSKAPAASSSEHGISAFGVTIADRASAAEKPPMSRQKKQVILLCCLAVASLPVLYWLYWPSPPPPDPALVTTPQIKPVIQAEQKKDIGQLQQFAASNDPIIASRAVTALAGLGHTEVIDGAIKDPRSEVRSAAIQSIAQRADVGQLETLSRYMRSDPSPDVRLNALSGVASIKDSKAFDPMLEMLNDPSPTLRRAAIRALEQKVGMKFSDFDVDRPSPAVIARVRQAVTGYKPTYEAIKDKRKGG